MTRAVQYAMDIYAEVLKCHAILLKRGGAIAPHCPPLTGSAFDLARAQVWSNFKHHSTIKFLIITPQGTISYVSHCAVGRISDKEIVERQLLSITCCLVK